MAITSAIRTGEREKLIKRLISRLKKALKEEKGVTLIEVLVVLAILVIAVGGASIGISLASSRNAEKCAREINDGLENARMLSLSRAGDYELTIDCSTRAMVLHNEPPGTDPDSTKNLQRRVNITLESEEEDLSSATSITVTFDKSTGKVKTITIDGSAYAGDIIRIHTANEEGTRQADVVLIRNTGKHYVEF